MTKSKWIAIILCIFLGFLGVHRFYERKIASGVLYLFTLGLFGLGIIVDLIILCMQPSDSYDGGRIDSLSFLLSFVGKLFKNFIIATLLSLVIGVAMQAVNSFTYFGEWFYLVQIAVFALLWLAFFVKSVHDAWWDADLYESSEDKARKVRQNADKLVANALTNRTCDSCFNRNDNDCPFYGITKPSLNTCLKYRGAN